MSSDASSLHDGGSGVGSGSVENESVLYMMSEEPTSILRPAPNAPSAAAAARRQSNDRDAVRDLPRAEEEHGRARRSGGSGGRGGGDNLEVVGTEGAKLAADNAIDSVNWAMQQVHQDAVSKLEQIRRLHEENERLEEELGETQADLRTSQHELKQRELALKEFSERSEELFRSLAAEQAAFQKLKEEVALEKQKYAELEMRNGELLERQVNERSVRDELATEMASMQQEINDLELEKSKFQHHYAELEMKLRIEMEAFDSERDEWKERQLRFLAKLQEEQELLRAEKLRNEEVIAELGEVAKRNEYLEHQLQAQERQLRESATENRSTLAELDKVTEVKEQYRIRAENAKNSLHAAQEDLKKANEEMRVMAEKVFQLMSQLDELDSRASTASAAQLEAERNAMAHKRKLDSATKKLGDLEEESKKLNRQVDRLKTKLDKHTTQMLEYKSKYKSVLKAKKRLEMNVRGQDSALRDMTSKHNALNSKLVAVKNGHVNYNKAIKLLKKELSTLRGSERELKQTVVKLEKDKKRLSKSVASRNAQLAKYKRREDLYTQLREQVSTHDGDINALDTVEAFEERLAAETRADDDDALNRVSTSSVISAKKRLMTLQGTIDEGDEDEAGSPAKGKSSRKGSKRRGSRRRAQSLGGRGKPRIVPIKQRAPNDYARERAHRMRVRKLLRGRDGKTLRRVLQSLQIDETDVLKWSIEPDRFFNGLSTMAERMEEFVQRKQNASVKDHEIRLVHNKNRQLLKRAESESEHKTKAVMRLALILARSADNKSGNTFLTQMDGAGVGAGMAGASGKKPRAGGGANVELLDLSDNGLTNTEAKYVASALKYNNKITTADLSHNAVDDDALMKLVVACIFEESAVEQLDLRHNSITLAGLQLLVEYMKQSLELTTVREVHFCEERGRSIVPYLVVRTSLKSLAIDLRHNPLFPKGTMSVHKRNALDELASVLAQIQDGSTRLVTSIHPDAPENPRDNEAQPVQRLEDDDEVVAAAAAADAEANAPPATHKIMSDAGRPSVLSRRSSNKKKRRGTKSAKSLGRRSSSSTSGGDMPSFMRPRRRSSRRSSGGGSHFLRSSSTTAARRSRSRTSRPARSSSKTVAHTSSLPSLSQAKRGKKAADRTFTSSLRSGTPSKSASFSSSLPTIGGVRGAAGGEGGIDGGRRSTSGFRPQPRLGIVGASV